MSRFPASHQPARTSPQPERRRSSRKPHVSEAFLSSPTGGRKIEVSSVDVSRHGVRLCVGSAIAAGIYQRLESGTGEQQTVREIHILSCRPEPDGTFH
ncbi:MAG TPA: hypothetical protein VLJ39_12275, partial [Tepidisphaeraceae bacterium]|nr:hypothetical protein [Tepidisphaeraceae bacterium]